MTPIPVIIDSEIGPNIDDAFSLALALCSPEIELIGVTIVSDVDGAATGKATELVTAFGANIPVIRGGTAKTLDLEGQSCTAGRSAAHFLANETRRRPGQVVVITNGPLTNVALTIRSFPDFAKNVKCIVSMAGWTGQRLSEWNVRSDPLAMKTLLSSDIPLYLFGLDVTNACPINEIHVKLLKESASESTQLLLKHLEAWQAKNDKPAMLHDPLTVAFLCHPDLVVMENARVQLEGKSGVLALGDEGKAVSVCRHVDVLKYLDLVIDRLTSKRELAPQLVHRLPRVPPGSAIHRTPPPLLYNALELPYRPGWILDPLARTEHQVIMVRKGSLVLEIGSETYQGNPGDVFFIPSDVVHSMQSHTGMQLLLIFFQLQVGMPNPQAAADEWFRDLRETAFQVPLSHSTPFVRVMEDLVRSHMQQTVESLLISKSLLYELLALLLDSVRASTGVNGLNAQQLLYVDEAKKLIEEQTSKRFSLIELESAIGISKYYLSRLFQQRFGVSPGAYHTKLRMNKAIELVQFGHLSIAEIADHLGFYSIHSFSRAFKAYTGVSPTSYSRNVPE